MSDHADTREHVPTDCADPATINEVIAEVVRHRRFVEFVEVLCDGAQITVNGIPWREAFDRLNALMSEPQHPASSVEDQ